MTDEITYNHALGDTLALSGTPIITWDNERTVVKQENNAGISNDPNKCLRKITISSFTASTNLNKINSYMKPDEAIDYSDVSPVSAAIRHNFGTAYADDTTDANDAGAGDIYLIQQDAQADDAAYIGLPAPTTGIIVTNATTAADWVLTLTWEYYDGDSWESLQGIVDETDSFQNLGSDMFITWDVPPDWEPTTINSQGPFYYVRARVSAFTSINQTFLADQMWAIGAYPFVTVVIDSSTSWSFPCQMHKPTVRKSNDTTYSIDVTFQERTF